MESKKLKYPEFHIQLVYKMFCEVFSKATTDQVVIDNMFDDVLKNYSSKSRHYHDMNHIYGMCSLWQTDYKKLKNPDAVFFAIIYHDIIYKPRRNDNEEKSAEYFKKNVAAKLGLSSEVINQVYNAIIATKHNDASKSLWEKDKDIQFLLDFDLSVLGTKHESAYEWYRKGVRKEYRIYPDMLYKPGRKKVLESFLKREKIYITKEYQNLFEKTARKNLQNEIKSYLC